MGNYAFYGKIYRRKAGLYEDFGSGCLNCDLWDLGIFRIGDGRVERVGVGNPSYRKQSVRVAPTEDVTRGR